MDFKSIFAVFGGFLLAVVLVFVAYQYRGRIVPMKSVSVTAKWLHQSQFAGMYVAKEEGLFKRNGLDVTINQLGDADNRVEDLLSGKVEFIYMSAEGFTKTVHDGADVKAVAAIYQISPYVFVSLDANGIKSPADLKGKVIGNKGGTLEQRVIARLLLKTVGLSEKDVTIKDVPFGTTELEDLQNRTVDVIGLYRTDQLYMFDNSEEEYHVINPISYNVLYPERYGVQIFNDVLVTRNELIEQDPDMVRTFVRATIDGWEKAIKNVDMAVSDTMKYVTDEHYQDEAYEKYILEKSIPLIKPNSITKIGFMDFASWQILHNHMTSSGEISDDLDYEDMFTNEFIP